MRGNRFVSSEELSRTEPSRNPSVPFSGQFCQETLQ
jgi:hypothetical protein